MPRSKGRSAGVPNYKNDLLINVVEAILPDGPLQWRMVSTRYKEASGEVEERDPHDLKRHFTTSKNMCNNGKKVTGSSAPKATVARCQDIWRRILAKSSAINCGGDGSESESSDSEEEIDESTQFEEDDANEVFDAAPIDSQYDEPVRDEDTNHDEDNVEHRSFSSSAIESQCDPATTVPSRTQSVSAPLVPPLPLTARNLSSQQDAQRRQLRQPFSAPPRQESPRLAVPVPIVPLVQQERGVRAPSPLAAPRNPSPAPGQKRRGIAEPEEVGKSKNSRHNPRGSAGAALTSLANAFTQRQTQSANEPNMMQVMLLQMQMQQQSQEQARVQQNQQFQMMMMMMAPSQRSASVGHRDLSEGFSSSAVPSSSASYTSNSSNGSRTDRNEREEKGDY